MKKTRNTRQRTVILEILRAECVHLTAEEICRQARKTLPSVSLGTVYRNLNFLQKMGLAREIRNGETGSARFEAARDVHAHFHCRCCRKVRDVELPPELAAASWRNAGPIASVEFLDLHVIGNCTDCSPGA